MARCSAGAEALFFDLHYVFYCEFLSLWHRTQPWVFAPVSRYARGVWRRLAADGAVHPGRQFCSREARAGLLAVWHHDHLRPCHWSDAGRLDHRQLLLALDFLYQRSSWHSCTHTGLSAGRGPALHSPPEGRALQLRLYRILSSDPGRRRIADRPRQGTGRRLVRISLHYHLGRDRRRGPSFPDRLGMVSETAY